MATTRQAVGRKPAQRSALRANIADFVRNPIQSSISWFDSYFLNQTPLFYRLAMLIVFMLGCGLVMVLSASNVASIKATGDAFAEFRSQTYAAILGLLFMIFISMRTVALIQRFSMLFWAGSIFLQVLVQVPGIGKTVGGNTNWLAIGPLTLQPSEFLKLGIILALAVKLSPNLDELWNWRKGALPLVLYGILPAGLIFATSQDLGTTLVIIAFIVALAFLIGMPMRDIGIIVAIGAVSALIFALSSQNRMNRILAFLGQTDSTAADTTWQTDKAAWALASGGLFGTGLGDSKMKWGWIPEVENDFIFSIVGEEVGLLGAVVVLVLFFMLARYIRKVSLNSTTNFGAIAVTGVMLWIIIQAFINIGVVLGLFPVIGVPLPLFSKGGSSMLAVLMALGVVLAVERDQDRPKRRVRKK
jgi:cell division protein FtsW